MKAKKRKEAMELLSTLKGREVNKLRAAMAEKGFLSKKELKILQALAERANSVAA